MPTGEDVDHNDQQITYPKQEWPPHSVVGDERLSITFFVHQQLKDPIHLGHEEARRKG